MARTWVATDDLVEGALPGVCARTGAATSSKMRLRFPRLPPWVPAALTEYLPPRLLGLLASGTVPGLVPLRPATRRRMERLALVRNLAALLAVVVLGVAFWLGEVLVLALAGLLALVAIVWTGIVVAVAIAGRVDASGDWVELRGVHDAFAQAINEKYEDEESP